MKTKTLTAEEAEALFEAAEYARKNQWGAKDLAPLNSAIRKLRHANQLIIEEEHEDLDHHHE